MRLLNSRTLELEEYIGAVPYYAILSYRWEEDEVTFQDLKGGRWMKMKGAAKIYSCCEQAVKDGWEYAWIDSCCIDKSSSAELSEAINSMFAFYENAQACYAYLCDVTHGTEHSDFVWEFSRSKWFHRGWTLQELLAPRTVVFFNASWDDIGTKFTAPLDQMIRQATGINDLVKFKEASVAQKMSWASKRQTTRIEDTAYCLMGLFGIHMPLLYGEGASAFIRLQKAILEVSDDESIFAWDGVSSDSEYSSTGMLALDPSLFSGAGGIIPFKFFERPSYTITNKGLSMQVTTKYRFRKGRDGDRFGILLNCVELRNSLLSPPISIWLVQTETDGICLRSLMPIRASYWPTLQGGFLSRMRSRHIMSQFRLVPLCIKEDTYYRSKALSPPCALSIDFSPGNWEFKSSQYHDIKSETKHAVIYFSDWPLDIPPVYRPRHLFIHFLEIESDSPRHFGVFLYTVPGHTRTDTRVEAQILTALSPDGDVETDLAGLFRKYDNPVDSQSYNPADRLLQPLDAKRDISITIRRGVEGGLLCQFVKISLIASK